MRKIIAFAAPGILLAILLALFCLEKPVDSFKNVEFEYVASLTKTNELTWDYWFTLRDANKGTDITTEIMSGVCNIGSIQMDFDEFTYVISDGFELVELSYTHSDLRGRFSITPRYYGYATLQRADETMFYVYRIPCDVPVIKDMHAHYGDDYRTTVLT